MVETCIETQSSAANQAKGSITKFVIEPLAQLVLKAYPGFNALFYNPPHFNFKKNYPS
jgi:hypothetical protein